MREPVRAYGERKFQAMLASVMPAPSRSGRGNFFVRRQSLIGFAPDAPCTRRSRMLNERNTATSSSSVARVFVGDDPRRQSR